MIEFTINVSEENIELNDFPFCGGHKLPNQKVLSLSLT